MNEKLILDSLASSMAQSLMFEESDGDREVAFAALSDYLDETEDNNVVLEKTTSARPQQWLRLRGLRFFRTLGEESRPKFYMTTGWDVIQAVCNLAGQSLGYSHSGLLDHYGRCRIASTDAYITEPYGWHIEPVRVAIRMAVVLRCGLLLSHRAAHNTGCWRAAFLNIDTREQPQLYRVVMEEEGRAS